MTREDLRALEAEIDLCTNVENLKLIRSRIPRWKRRAKKKSHELASYFDTIKWKVDLKIHDLRHKWDTFELGAIPSPPAGATYTLPKSVKKLHRVAIDSMSGELVFYGEPADE